MSALHDISELLGQWLQYTRAETAAIESSAWPALHNLQAAKSGLQKSVTAAFDRWASENRLEPARARAEHPFRAQVNHLISLEAGNSQLLSHRLHTAAVEKKSHEDAARNLRRVRRSYGGKHGVGWQSYS